MGAKEPEWARQKRPSSPLKPSDLVFSSQANHNFSRILTDLKRSNLSISNRLQSIRDDANFVLDVADAYGERPLVANERCGGWYIRTTDKAGSAYFKSTDGHAGQWAFSVRRLNLQLLDLIGAYDGCIVVDSTRRGKRMPDALSKTVPLWCCVLNRVLFPADQDRHALFTPPTAVSESEHALMLSRVPDFVQALHRLRVDLDGLRGRVRKPLRPVWVTQESTLMPTDEVFAGYHPVICCTSSRHVAGAEMSEAGYIQGAGDDTEHWALGLTPSVFWENEDALLSTPESVLPDLVTSLVQKHSLTQPRECAPKQIAPAIFVGTLIDQESLAMPPASTCTISLLSVPATPADTWSKSPSHMEIGLGKHKLASRNLRVALPQLIDFVTTFYAKAASDQVSVRRVLVLCQSGKDLCIGVALALLCHCFDEDGTFNPHPTGLGVVNKDLIRVKLGRIMTHFPEANPSRATLQSVNSFLMG